MCVPESVCVRACVSLSIYLPTYMLLSPPQSSIHPRPHAQTYNRPFLTQSEYRQYAARRGGQCHYLLAQAVAALLREFDRNGDGRHEAYRVVGRGTRVRRSTLTLLERNGAGHAAAWCTAHRIGVRCTLYSGHTG
jgi:hypothetical protein